MKQGLHEISAVKMYPMGMQYKSDDQLYRYSFAAQALGGVGRLVLNSNWAPGATDHADEDGFSGALTIKAPIGQMYVDVPDTIARAKDYYQGGHLYIKTAARVIWHQHYIVKSDVGTGAVVRCWLSKPIAVDDAEIDDTVIVWPSIYSACINATLAGGIAPRPGYETFVGLPLRPVTISNYFWLLTAGPVFVQGGAVYPGAAESHRECYADFNDGTVRSDLNITETAHQRVGFVLPVTNSIDDSNTLIMLQLDQ